MAISHIVEAIAAAETQTLVDHQSGACRDSEWSCSHCELAESGEPLAG